MQMNEQQGVFGRAASEVSSAFSAPSDPQQLAAKIQTMRRIAIFALSATAGVGLGTILGKVIGPSCSTGR